LDISRGAPPEGAPKQQRAQRSHRLIRAIQRQGVRGRKRSPLDPAGSHTLLAFDAEDGAVAAFE
jgi:hypothetical protein